MATSTLLENIRVNNPKAVECFVEFMEMSANAPLKPGTEELENRPLGDGGNIIYVNGQYRNVETLIGQLMHDFSCVDASEIINPLLRERVHYLKETEGGREEMCQIMENRINEEKIELAKKAIARGKLSLEEIAETLSLPLAFVQELARPKAVMA